MRVIAGNYKGRTIKPVPGKYTRPTSDKVKEAIFHMMGPFFSGGKCLDLFAGSGSLGLEALSRGMEHVTFVDQQGRAIQTINDNLKTLNINTRAEVYRMDAFRALHMLAKQQSMFELILIDPPYLKVDYELLLNKLIDLKLMQANGIIYCEHGSEETLPSSIPHLTLVKQVNYGQTTGITLYRHTP